MGINNSVLENVQRKEETKPRKNYRKKPWMTSDGPEKKLMRDAIEGTTMLEKYPHLLPLSQILAKNGKESELFCDELKNRGYACLKNDCPEIKNTSDDLTVSALDYLNQPLSIKEKNISPIENSNVGYVHIPGVREYMKLHPLSSESLWPEHPDTFKTTFSQFHKSYTQIALTCFHILANWIDYEEPKPIKYIPDAENEGITKRLSERSSLSMIKYYPLEKDTEVCDEHTDTGVMTFITRTQRPSLEVWDRSEKKYIKIEELLDIGDIVVFISEKVPLFSGSMRIKPTLHRVRMSSGPERLSIAYLLDTSTV